MSVPPKPDPTQGVIPAVAPVASGSEPEKRPVSVRAKETATTGYRAVRWIVLIVLLVTAAVFIIRNFERVEVDWVFGQSSIPLAAIMLGFLLAGLAIGWLAHWFSRRSRR